MSSNNTDPGKNTLHNLINTLRTPSPKEVAAACTGAGGFKRKTLESWGVPWPPPHGWRKDLRRRWEEEREEQYQANETLARLRL